MSEGFNYQRDYENTMKLHGEYLDKIERLEKELADAKTLFAQQAKRADEAENALAAANQRISMLEAAWLESEGITADQTRLEPSVEGVLRLLEERDAALAHAAELRRALEPFAQMEVSEYATSERHPRGADAAKALYRYMAAISHVHAPGERIVDQSAIWELAQAARAALAISPGEPLERIKRDARLEALEALPCDQTVNGCEESWRAEDAYCPRCRALAEARKGEQA